MTKKENNYHKCFEWYKDENAESYIKSMMNFKNLKNHEPVTIQEVEMKQRKLENIKKKDVN